MTDLFMKILDMSLASSVVILIVMLLRLVLKRAPKICSYILWAAVLIKLLLPVTIRADFGIMPSFAPVSDDYSLAGHSVGPLSAANAAYRALGDALNGGLGVQYIRVDGGTAAGSAVLPVSWYDVWIVFGRYVWFIGMAFLILKGLRSYFVLRRKLAGSVLLKDNIYYTPACDVPFVWGVFKPKIYLPMGLSDEESSYIILHEKHHIKRGDHVAKLVFYAAVCLHWFNPLVWAAFRMFSSDMEMSCDEAVVGKLGGSVRADYSMSLLKLASDGGKAFAAPIAFSEGGTAARIKNLGKWKKWPVIAAAILVLICVFVCVFLITGESPQYTSELPAEEGYYFIIKSENANSVEVNTPYSSGGTVHADGSPMKKGERIYLEQLEKYENLSGVTVSALDAGGGKIHEFEVPIDASQSEAQQLILDDPWFFCPKAELEYAMRSAVLDHYSYYEPGVNGVHTVAFEIIGGKTRKLSGKTEVTVYAHVLQQVYTLENGKLTEGSGSYIPTRFVFTDTGSGAYILKEYREPRDGSYNDDDIKTMFPLRFRSKAFDGQKYVDDLIKECENQAAVYFLK